MTETTEQTPLERIEAAISESLCLHLCDMDGSNEDVVLRNAARSVLQAIREPSAAMSEAGITASALYDAADSLEMITHDAWQAMIDAALGETTIAP